jgi:hypothetical protein
MKWDTIQLGSFALAALASLILIASGARANDVSTIQAGKSTLTRFASVPTRRALLRSTWSRIFPPESNLRSKFFAFIKFHFLIT